MRTRKKDRFNTNSITSESRIILVKVANFMIKEASRGSLVIPLSNYKDRIMLATGISDQVYSAIVNHCMNFVESEVANPLNEDGTVILESEKDVNHEPCNELNDYYESTNVKSELDEDNHEVKRSAIFISDTSKELIEVHIKTEPIAEHTVVNTSVLENHALHDTLATCDELCKLEDFSREDVKVEYSYEENTVNFEYSEEGITQDLGSVVEESKIVVEFNREVNRSCDISDVDSNEHCSAQPYENIVYIESNLDIGQSFESSNIEAGKSNIKELGEIENIDLTTDIDRKLEKRSDYNIENSISDLQNRWGKYQTRLQRSRSKILMQPVSVLENNQNGEQILVKLVTVPEVSFINKQASLELVDIPEEPQAKRQTLIKSVCDTQSPQIKVDNLIEPYNVPGNSKTEKKVIRRKCTCLYCQSGGKHKGHTKLHVCEFCEKEFKKSSALQCHIRQHTDERPYECEWCKKTFRRSDECNRHKKTHTGEKNYHCGYCARQFSRSDHLHKHLLIHTPKVDKGPFFCNHCNLRFLSKIQLHNHIHLVHTANEDSSQIKNKEIDIN